MNDEELSATIRDNATRHRASESLRASVRTQIALHAAGQDTGDVAPKPRWPGFGWRSAITGFALGSALTLLVSIFGPGLLLRDSLPEQLVARHVHALKAGPLIEVASSDQHTVKPWYQGKLDYAPPVIDLEAEGFPLLGGRVDQVKGAPVATLAYGSRQHILNVFVWPSDGKSAPDRLQRRGFNINHWSDGSMQVWVVSDMEAGEVERFSRAWRTRAQR